MKKSSFKRKTLLINREFQLSFIRHMLLLTFFVIALFYAANLYHFWNLREQGLSLGLPATHVFFKFLRQQQGTMDIIFALASVAAGITIIGYGLFLSHRVAGPLHRLKKYLRSPDAISSTYRELKFRENDYFSDVAQAVNERLKKDRS